MFSALHELLVNYLASKVLARLDMDGLLNDGICSTSKGLAGAILMESRYGQGFEGRQANVPGKER